MDRLSPQSAPEQQPPSKRNGRHSATPPQDGAIRPQVAASAARQRSGELQRPLTSIARAAVSDADAVTELERYKAAMRRFGPVQKGRAGLPWEGQWFDERSQQVVSGRFIYDEADDRMLLELDAPDGPRRIAHHDVLFVKNPRPHASPRQPQRTHSGFPIRPILQELPRTVETLCPECSALLLGRYFEQDGAVWVEKTCPDHGYFRDKINSDVQLYLKGTRGGFEDERGVLAPQVTGGAACPSDCGICNQHHSTTCLGQIDLTNRCNLDCPVCFASANQAGYVAEPSYEMVVELLQNLRNLHPTPATAVQFTGGEPTIHPRFFDICRAAREMGFSHIQIATNGLRMASYDFAEKARDAGLHTLYLQFDGLDDALYEQLRGKPLLQTKLKVVENCRALGLKICLVPTIVKSVNQEQVGQILHFAAQNADVISGIAYQPVSFSGRIDHDELAQKRYTLGDLAHDIADATGADPYEDFFPLNHVVPLSRIMQVLDGKPKIRPSCHSDCAFGTYFFVTPEGKPVPIPHLFDTMRLFSGLNDIAARVEATRPDGKANWRDKLAILWVFLSSYRWLKMDRRITPLTFIKALRGMTNKQYGRGDRGAQTFRTLLAAGMHFMDRYNFDTERIRRCVILYSSADGVYPFCTINCGPTFRPFIEKMYAEPQPAAAEG